MINVFCQECGNKAARRAKCCSRKCSAIAKSKAMKGITPKNIGKIAGWNKGMSNSWSTGENNKLWKGDRVGKTALHDWVKLHYGFPNTCEHCGFASENHHKIHWANKSGNYRRSREDWLRLCVSCHKKYDVRDKKTHCNHGHNLSTTGRIDAKGWRYCHICRLSDCKRYRNNKKLTKAIP